MTTHPYTLTTAVADHRRRLETSAASRSLVALRSRARRLAGRRTGRRPFDTGSALVTRRVAACGP
jgi:hypothetical protein